MIKFDNLNINLDTKHVETCLDGKSVSNPAISEVKCFLNWNDNRVEFSVISNYAIRIVPDVISFDYSHNISQKHNSKKLSIDSQVSTSKESSFTKIHASFFSKPIDLFSPHKKFFKFEFHFKHNSDIYVSTYAAAVPEFQENNGEKSQLPSNKQVPFLPWDVCGPELLKLYNNNFETNKGSTQDEKNMLNDIKDYIKSTTLERFEEKDFLRMMQISYAIENIKETDDKTIRMQSQRIYQFQYGCPDYPDIVDKLKATWCDENLQEFQKRAFVMKIKDKMLPQQCLEFEKIHVYQLYKYQQVERGDKVELTKICIEGNIKYIFGKIVVFEVKKQADNCEIVSGELYHVDFIPNLVVSRVVQKTLLNAIDNELEDFLYNFKGECDKQSHKIVTKFQWMNPSFESNVEQQLAAKNIVNRTSYPAPYLVFGPPGTGKTTTIIEAIAQILKHKPNSKILVTAGSNSSCDDLAVRLLKYVSINKIFRLYSTVFSDKPEKIHPELEKISNFQNMKRCKHCNERNCPCENASNIARIRSANVVLSTLISCDSIVKEEIGSEYFNYIFIDEAACQSEQNILVPITAFGISKKRIFSQIVLSGDPRQLGPIVKHSMSTTMGMDKSMMERLIETLPQYKNFHEKYIMRLVQNYRSHPAIIHFSNEQFYEGKLECFCDEDIANFAIGWNLLSNEKFPIMFHNAISKCEKVGHGFENANEVKFVELYIERILGDGINNKKVHQKDIGVIAPYQAQRALLTRKLSRFKELEVGTVDAFQGKEKKIIIFSAVRSQSKHVGFLGNKKRLNVALTRAQSLLIIIGNSETLEKSPIWKKFIEYCRQNGAIKGQPRSTDNEVV